MMLPPPLFETSTAYKHLLTQQRNENDIYALFAYRTGNFFQKDPTNSTVGIEHYQIANSDYTDDYYNLLNAVYDYQIFLTGQHTENSRLFDLLKKEIDAFNTKHDGHFKQKNLMTRIRTLWTLSGINTRSISVNPYEGYNPLIIPKDDKRNYIEIISGEPVFNVYKISNNNSYYVYKLVLTKPVTLKNQYMFLQHPCIHIALFKKENDAREYYNNSVSESLKFRKDLGYASIKEACYPAIQRFETYFSQKQY